MFTRAYTRKEQYYAIGKEKMKNEDIEHLHAITKYVYHVFFTCNKDKTNNTMRERERERERVGKEKWQILVL